MIPKQCRDLLELKGVKFHHNDYHNDLKEIKKIGYITLKDYAHPYLHKNKYNNLTFNKLLLIYKQDNNFKSLILKAIESIERNIDSNIANLINKKYGRFNYLNVGLWIDRNQFNTSNKVYKLQKSLIKRLKNKCKHVSKDKKRNNITNNHSSIGKGYPSINLAVKTFTLGDTVYFYKYLSINNKRKLSKIYECSPKELFSWLQCLCSIRNLCAHNGHDLIDLELGSRPIVPKMFKNLIYSNNNVYSNSIAISVFIIKYLMLSINESYDFSKIEMSLNKLINVKSLPKNTRNNMEKTANRLGFSNLHAIIGLSLNRKQFLMSIKHHYVYSNNNPYIKDKDLIHIDDLMTYLKYTALLHNTNLSQISLKYINKDRSYIHTTFSTDTLGFIKKLLKYLAAILGVHVESFYKVLTGSNNKHIIKDIKDRYIFQQIAMHKHNYVWGLCVKKHISPKLLAKKLHVSTLNARHVESSRKPNLVNIIKISKVLNMSPYALGKKFKYPKRDIYNEIKNNSSKIDKYITKLLNKNNISESELGVKIHVAQSVISAWERPNVKNSPSLDNLISLSRAFKKPLIKLLSKHPNYSNIQVNSPAYKFLQLCKYKHIIISTNNFTKIFGTTLGNRCEDIISNLRNSTDFMDTKVSDQLIDKFDLPEGYFGVTRDKRFLKLFTKYTKEHPELGTNDVGYRLEYIRAKNHYTLHDIGKKLHLTRERVRQLTLKRGSDISGDTLKRLLSITKTKEQRKYLLGNIHLTQQLGFDF